MCKFYAPCNQGLTVSSSDVVSRFKRDKSVVLKDLGDGRYQTESPDGYIFYLVDKNKTNGNTVYHNPIKPPFYTKLLHLSLVSPPLTSNYR